MGEAGRLEGEEEAGGTSRDSRAAPGRSRELRRLCGRLVVGGFEGHAAPARYLRALRDGERGGAILFRRNVESTAQVASLLGELRRAASFADGDPLLGVDQEGGRVSRLPPPFLRLPPMRALGAAGDVELTRRAGRVLGEQLAALGFRWNFAPVLDVDSNPQNPVIGDRAFARDPDAVALHGVALAAALQAEGILACGKHFPGHGDTDLDSHVALPVVRHERARLERIELSPFRAAVAAGIASIMTAHVVATALDPDAPATLSPAVGQDLLRREMGFAGVLVSDDLEMGAIAARHSPAEAALLALRAGCDVFLVCRSEDGQDAAFEALVREAERDPFVRSRVEESAGRVRRVLGSVPARAPRPESELSALFDAPEARELSGALARLARPAGVDPTER